MRPHRPLAENKYSVPSEGQVEFGIPPRQRKIIPITIPTPAIEKQLKAETSEKPHISAIVSSAKGNGCMITSEPPATDMNQADSETAVRCSTATRSAVNGLLDVFSPNYVPLWLQAVNESPTNLQPCRCFPTLDFESYIATIVGSDFAHPISYSAVPPPVWSALNGLELAPTDYCSYWLKQLQNEFAAQYSQHQSFNLYNQRLQPLQERPDHFSLHVPGLRENAPRIDLGDSVHIRVLGIPSIHTDSQAAQWLQYGRQYGTICPGFTGLMYTPHVWEIDRQNERVVLCMENFRHSGGCNINFPLQESRLEPLCRAVHKPVFQDPWLRSMLFPEPSDGVIQSNLTPGRFDITWCDNLNWEQKKAVFNILKSKYGNVPYLISGPPGTGKTKTLVETALQMIQQPGHLLLCAPSDAAADTLALRLSKYLEPSKLFRLNSWSRTFAEVPDRLLLYTYSNGSSFSLPPVEVLLSSRIVVTTCRDADMLIRARLTNSSLSKLYNGVKRLLVPGSPPEPLHWTALLLDEAAQATEPEAMIPLTVVMPLEGDPPPQFIAAGDQYQLGPKLVSKSKLGVSLFERLFERPSYRDHPLSRANGNLSLNSKMLPMIRPAFTNLIRNYRSHPAILSIPSSIYYNDTLIAERRASIQWPGWPSKERWPVLFVQNDSPDAYESITDGDGTGTGTLCNPGEAALAVKLVESLLQHLPHDGQAVLNEREIMIMSPFRAQVAQLRKEFRRKDMYDVNIGPLEAFQGLESRVVIVCTTRTRVGAHPQSESHHIIVDKSRGLGLIDEPQRLNVAMTRAQEGLIVVGNARCLVCTHDVQWLRFLDFCKRNNCYTAPAQFQWPNIGGPYSIGRLERALRYAALGKVDIEQSKKLSEIPSLSIQSHNFKLKGRPRDMDEEMWQFKELAQLSDSEDIDMVLTEVDDGKDAEHGQIFDAHDSLADKLSEDYDRNLTYEFSRECNTQ